MIYTCTFNPAIDYKLETNSFTQGELNRSTFNKFVAGGKGINVSIVLNNLGIKNIATGFTGGFTGDYLKQFLTEEFKLSTNFINIHDLTRLNVKLNNNGIETEVNQEGPQVSRVEMDKMLTFVDTMKKRDILAVGGSPSRGYASSYDELIEKCVEKEIEFIIDSNQSSLMDTLCHKPLLVKPNIFELKEIFNEEIDSEEDIIFYAKKLLQFGAKNVIVSLGAAGSYFINNSFVYKANSIKGNVKNTVGAGDSMVAGFLAGLSMGYNSVDCYKMAIACGTATAFSYDLATKYDATSYFDKIKIQKVQ
jgi:1-phosphofructokinase